jgi:hypothetical protein
MNEDRIVITTNGICGEPTAPADNIISFFTIIVFLVPSCISSKPTACFPRNKICVPQILMLSGIGPKQHLVSNGVRMMTFHLSHLLYRFILHILYDI